MKSKYTSKIETPNPKNYSKDGDEIFDNIINYGIPIINGLLPICLTFLTNKQSKPIIVKNVKLREISKIKKDENENTIS